ncbi:phytanoyl-CoA dioxygenase family protein [Plantactinospora sonchi]|uniref:Phytanoyl-CoA dioxygenase family protein n=1 Tax=Plantactinospora sonchi TaxID=1544735 RepID=A0ABU7RUH7_9ACTN
MSAAITPHEMAQFVREGIVIRRNFVDSELVDRARLLINGWYQGKMQSDLIESYTQRTFAPELGTHPDMLALFHESGIFNLVASLVPETQPVSTTQIQIRIPDAQGAAQSAKAMHVDGVACPHLDPAELRTFTLLVGVVLSEVTDRDSGALRYVPGGHLRMAEWFRSEWSAGMTDQVPPHIDDEEGTPLLGQPGDVLLMHHLVPHAVGRNTSMTPRVMAYFRVAHARHAHQRLEALRDPWLEYAPLQPLAI